MLGERGRGSELEDIWRCPAKLASGGFVGDLTVFDVGGNRYRLIAYIQYQRGNVLIKNILTHKEFDEGAWKR